MRDVRFIEIYPRAPLRGVFYDLIDSLSQEFIPNINKLKAMSGTLAFNSDFTDEMFVKGRSDGLRVLGRHIEP